MSRPAVFLDRDGVVTEHVSDGGGLRPPWLMAELRIAPDVAAAVATLADEGLALVAVTNQPDVARGKADGDEVRRINERVASELRLDAIYACMHDGSDGCDCRKPQPGMLRQAAIDLDLDLNRSWLVGDRWVDIAAGRAAGVRTILLERPTSWSPTSAGPAPVDLRPDDVVDDLPGAVDVIVRALRRRPPDVAPPADVSPRTAGRRAD